MDILVVFFIFYYFVISVCTMHAYDMCAHVCACPLSETYACIYMMSTCMDVYNVYACVYDMCVHVFV